MKILVFAQLDTAGLRSASLCAMGFARQVADATNGEVCWLLLGQELSLVADQASSFATALVADDPCLQRPRADRWAKVLAEVVRDRQRKRVSSDETFASPGGRDGRPSTGP